MNKPERQSKLEQLKSAKNRSDFAKIINYSLKGLTYVVYGLSEEEKYKNFSIPKKSGGLRTISAPCELLKHLQSRVAELLLDCLKEIHETQDKPVSKFSHGFSKGKNIFTNGAKHKNKKFVLNLDIEDFFGSISFSRIRGYFVKNKYFSLDDRIAILIAHIACKGKILPQGSPLSPVISNMLGEILDSRLSRLAHKNGCSYTRYADDITFSTNRKDFPSSIAKKTEKSSFQWVIGKSLEKIFKDSNFRINESKFRMQDKFHRQEVTGLVVNKKTNATSGYRYLVRSLVHEFINKGEFYIKTASSDSGKVLKGTKSQLQGMLSFLLQARKFSQNKDFEGRDASRGLAGLEKICRKFIIYTRIYRPELPFLMFEGKTDSVYLKCAIRREGARFPYLFDSRSEKFSVNFQSHRNYNNFSFNGLSGIPSGGAGSFGEFVKICYDCFKKFPRTDVPRNPVILILDQDKAGKKAWNSSKHNIDEKDSRGRISDGVFHLFDNMYLVFVPDLPDRNVHDIESLFNNETRAGWIDAHNEDGKIKDKHRFSMFVKGSASEIDFSGFSPLLERLSLVIEQHKSRSEYSS